MSIVRLEQVEKSFGKHKVLHNINITLERGQFLVVTGPSGSGKTTLLRIIAGLDKPDRGNVFLHGKIASSANYILAPHRRHLGFVFQSATLWPHMTVYSNICFGVHNLGRKDRKERVMHMLQKMGLEKFKDRYPDTLSGGEAKRVALARSLAPSPLCLLMDEPLTNLDADLKDSLLDYILLTLKESKTALIYVTHDRSEAEKISTHQYRLQRLAMENEK